jgi:hypothetical protein
MKQAVDSSCSKTAIGILSRQNGLPSLRKLHGRLRWLYYIVLSPSQSNEKIRSRKFSTKERKRDSACLLSHHEIETQSGRFNQIVTLLMSEVGRVVSLNAYDHVARVKTVVSRCVRLDLFHREMQPIVGATLQTKALNCQKNIALNA